MLKVMVGTVISVTDKAELLEQVLDMIELTSDGLPNRDLPEDYEKLSSWDNASLYKFISKHSRLYFRMFSPIDYNDLFNPKDNNTVVHVGFGTNNEEVERLLHGLMYSGSLPFRASQLVAANNYLASMRQLGERNYALSTLDTQVQRAAAELDLLVNKDND